MPQNNGEFLDIEVAYATPDREIIIALKLPCGSRVNDAIELSGILQKVPEIDLAKNNIGIYGKLCSLNCMLYQHDRVEIYRPLTIDPKAIRRLRAGKNQSKAK